MDSTGQHHWKHMKQQNQVGELVDHMTVDHMTLLASEHSV